MEIDGKAASQRQRAHKFMTARAPAGDAAATGGAWTSDERNDVLAEAQHLAAVSLPYSYYQSGAARARQEVFLRRGRLTRELTGLGLPPVYEYPKGILIGMQVSTQPEGAVAPQLTPPSATKKGAATAGGPRDPQRKASRRRQPDTAPGAAAAITLVAWRQRRAQQALNPAHNPVMAHNVRLKTQLAAAAARGAAAAAAVKPQPSGRLLRHLHVQDEASRTIAKLRVVASGAKPLRLLSAPLSKPYYPRRRRGSVPPNEAEGGNLWPGKVARRAKEQTAAEVAVAEAVAHPGLPSAGAGRRHVQIQEIADVIVAAPQLGIHELGVYLPYELAADADNMAAAAALPSPEAEPSYGGSLSGQRRQRTIAQVPPAVPPPRPAGQHDAAAAAAATALPTAKLAEALRHLELRAAAGRAAVAAAEDDYGSHFVVHNFSAPAVLIPAPSQVASSYGSGGGHYLYEEGMAEDGESDGGGAGSDDENRDDGDDDDGGGVDGGSEREPYGSAASEDEAVQMIVTATVEENPAAGLVVTRYPTGGAVARQRARAARACSQGAGGGGGGGGGGYPAAMTRDGLGQASTPALAAATTPYDLGALGWLDAQPGNEVPGGWRRCELAAGAGDATVTTAASAAPAPTLSAPELLSAPAAPVPDDAADAANATLDASAETADKATTQQAPAPDATTAPQPAASVAAAATAAPWPEAARATAAMLRLPNEVSYTGRVRRLQQPEIAGKDLSGVWAKAAIVAVAARRGRHARGAQVVGGVGGGGGESGAATVAGANVPPPPWRRESHAERTEALLAAAAATAAAAMSAQVDAEVASGMAQEGRGGAGGSRPRIAARAAQPPLGPVTAVAARRAMAPSGGGGSGDGDRRAVAVTTWGGAQIGRAVARAVPATFAAAASGPPHDATAGAPPPVDAAIAASRTSVVAVQNTSEMATPAELLGAAAGGGSERRSPERWTATAPGGGGSGGGGFRAGNDLWGGGSLDRFGFLSDDAESAAAGDGDEAEVAVESWEDGRAMRRGQHHNRTRGPAAAAGGDDPWDSSSDDDDPWGVEDADEMGYPRAALAGTQSAPAGGGVSAGGGGGGNRRGPLEPCGVPGTAMSRNHVASIAAISAAPAAAARPGGRRRRAVVVARSAAGGGGGTAAAAASLRHIFGLATAGEVVIESQEDIPPLPLTPPPAWLAKLPPGSCGITIDREQADSAAFAIAKDHKQMRERQEPMGQVEAALLRAELIAPARPVRHDSRTFFFSEHPGFVVSS